MNRDLRTKPTFRTVLASCLELLTRRDRFLLGISAFLQISLSILDLLGIALLALVVAIATSAVQGTELPQIASFASSILPLNSSTYQELAAIIALIAAILLVGKSFLAYFLHYRNLKFLASRQARAAINLANLIMRQPLHKVQKFSSQEYQHSLYQGIDSALIGVLAGVLALIAEVSLQFVLLTALLFVSPTLFVVLIIYFGIIFGTLSWVLGRKVQNWSETSSRFSITGLRAISDFLGSFRETLVTNRAPHFVNEFAKSKNSLSSLVVKNSMSQQFSKYIFEISLIIGGLVFAAFAFANNSAVQAASMLALYVAAASRIGPSVLRAQHGIVLIRGSIGATVVLFEILSTFNIKAGNLETINSQESGPNSVELSRFLEFSKVSFRYPGSSRNAISAVSFRIQRGEFVAFVGPSGSGKSTLVDLLLGVMSPDSGEISFFGSPPNQNLYKRFKIGYVPQSVYLSQGSIIENVCLGLSRDSISVERVKGLLEQVGLKDWVANLPLGLETLVGEHGSRLSGGQKQRLGIARALYSKPEILVLDEATSALDARSELEISKLISQLKGNVTTIVVAHRLSTIKNSNRIFYISKGRIKGEGTFVSLQRKVPEFASQVKIMNLRHK